MSCIRAYTDYIHTQLPQALAYLPVRDDTAMEWSEDAREEHRTTVLIDA